MFLTGVLNPRGWEERLDAEEERCKRHRLDVVVLTVTTETATPPAIVYWWPVHGR